MVADADLGHPLSLHAFGRGSCFLGHLSGQDSGSVGRHGCDSAMARNGRLRALSWLVELRLHIGNNLAEPRHVLMEVF